MFCNHSHQVMYHRKNVSLNGSVNDVGKQQGNAEKTPSKLKAILEEKHIKLCKHGSMIGLCKHNCTSI